MKLAILSALIASTSAFAPASQKQVANTAIFGHQNGHQTAALFSKVVEVDQSSYSPDPQVWETAKQELGDQLGQREWDDQRGIQEGDFYGRDRHRVSQYDRYGHGVRTTVAEDIMFFLEEKAVQRDPLAQCLNALKQRKMSDNDRLWTRVLEQELAQKNSDIEFFEMTLEKAAWTVAEDIMFFLEEKVVQRDTLAQCLNALKQRKMSHNDRLWTRILEQELAQKNSDIEFFEMTLEKAAWNYF